MEKASGFSSPCDKFCLHNKATVAFQHFLRPQYLALSRIFLYGVSCLNKTLSSPWPENSFAFLKSQYNGLLSGRPFLPPTYRSPASLPYRIIFFLNLYFIFSSILLLYLGFIMIFLKFLQYILVRFTPSITFFYLPSPFLEQFQRSHCFTFIHEYIIFTSYLPSYTFSLYPLPCTDTDPQTRIVLPSCPSFMKKDILCVCVF
jgi:hypothetical protein